jgi:repressor LexA
MPTDRERQTLDFLRTFMDRHGVAPKLREIADHLGIQSRGTVHRYLHSLESEGLVSIDRARSRGIRLVGNPVSGAGQARLPVLGRIAAGLPIEAIPGTDEIDLTEFFIAPGRFVLRVAGDSMVGDGILDGDMVVVQQQDTARDGEIVVALIDNEEATLKRLQRNDDGSVTLRPANSNYAPMRYAGSRVRIQGVVVGQFRSYR